jgi:protein phosphatase
VACRLDVGSATSPGRVRSRNEDSFLTQHLSWCNLDRRRDSALLVVADGLGGHEAGDQASGMVIRIVGAALTPLLHEALTGQASETPPVRPPDAIARALREANHAVYQRGRSDPACRGMGATVAIVFASDGEVEIGLVGDCRVYHYRGDTLTQITRDQTFAQRMVDLGQLTPQEALTHPERAKVIQAIGNRSEVAPAAYHLALAPGDWLVAACDGLHAHLNSAALEEAIQQSLPSAAALAQVLVELADREGGMDNCTVAVVRCY